MSAPTRAAQTGVLLVFLAWCAAVLVRYDQVASAEALVAISLAVGWVAIFSMACLGAGEVAWLACGGRLGRWEDWLLAAGLGCAVLVTAGFVISLVGLFRPAPLAGVLTTAAGLGVRAVWRRRRELSWPPLSRRLQPLVVLIAGFAVATLLVAATASPFYDQFHYHLGFPYQWLRSGSMEVFPRHSYSYFPAAMGTLFAYPLRWLGTWSAQAIHWWTALLAVLATGALAGRLGGPRAAVVGAAMVATTPSLLQVSTWAAADAGATAFGALAWLILLRFWHRVAESHRVWVAAGALAGMAAAAKVLALTTVVAPVGLLAGLTRPRSVRAAVGRLALVGAGVAITFAPWAARNLLLTGDPLYPFGAAYLAPLFGVRASTGEVVASGIVGGEAGLKKPVVLATLATFQPRGEAGAIGPLYLAFLPLAAWSACRDRRRGAALLAAGLVLAWAGWAVGPPRGRYLLPVLPLLAALGAAGWRHAVFAAPRRVRGFLATLLLLALGWSATGATSPLEMRRLAATLGAADGEELMRRYVTYWPAIPFVNTELSPDAKVLLVGESRPYLLDRDLVVEDPFRRPLLVELAETFTTADGIAAELRSQGVTHLLVNHQEGRRIAVMNGRQHFLQPDHPEAVGRLAEFFTHCLRPVFWDEPVSVYALVECARQDGQTMIPTHGQPLWAE